MRAIPVIVLTGLLLALPPAVRADTPPGAEPITAETAGRVTRLARWGHGEPRRIAYSADGTVLAVGSWVGVAVYDAATLTERRVLETDEAVLDLAVSADGSVVAVAGSDSEGGTQVWRVADGALLGRVSPSRVVALSPDGQYLATERPGGRFGIWRLGDLELVREVSAPGYTFPLSMAFSSDSQQLAVG